VRNLSNVLPLKPELFDYVIIDEATQCDIATCIPALQRARNTVIVGDPKQLRHVSFLSKSIQHSLQQKYELNNSEVFDYREKSILDVAFESIESQDSVSFLHEHFRSTPQIIGFSNRYFYNDSLKIMTSLPDHQISESVKYFPVNGSRNKKGINETEANEIINKVSEIVIDQKDLDKAFSYRIGNFITF
jgi:superfamily I DNA and/or RNA helicase